MIPEVVEMSSQLGHSSLDMPKNWPKTTRFQTISENIIGKGLSEEVRKAIRMGKKEENMICCSCTTDCSQNPKCECLQMANEMNSTFGSEIEIFGKPINLESSNYDCWEQPRFSCGPLCSCNKDCSLNVLQDIDKDHNGKFEIKRIDEKGFCLYTKVIVKKGTPVIAFTGEIVGPSVVQDRQVKEYSIHMTAKNDPMMDLLDGCEWMDKTYKEALEKAYSSPTHLNTLKKGNCARFVSHSCEANLETLRIFQNGISPADLRIVLIAIDDIGAGEELTWDCGPKYVKEHLDNACLCSKCIREKEKNKKRSRSGPPPMKRSRRV